MLYLFKLSHGRQDTPAHLFKVESQINTFVLNEKILNFGEQLGMIY